MNEDFEITQVRRTLEHIRTVQGLLSKCSQKLFQRAIRHDATKFDAEEWPAFLEHTSTLSGLTYGSEEYKAALEDMKPALKSHYKKNRHHPEHNSYFECNGCFERYYGEMPERCGQCGYSQFQVRTDITEMTLIDLLEMLCDWIAATRRHADGDIRKSIEINQSRFDYSEELKKILTNTVIDLESKNGNETTP